MDYMLNLFQVVLDTRSQRKPTNSPYMHRSVLGEGKQKLLGAVWSIIRQQSRKTAQLRVQGPQKQTQSTQPLFPLVDLKFSSRHLDGLLKFVLTNGPWCDSGEDDRWE